MDQTCSVNKPEVINTAQSQLSIDDIEVDDSVHTDSHGVSCEDLDREEEWEDDDNDIDQAHLLGRNIEWDSPQVYTFEMVNAGNDEKYSGTL